MDVTRDLSHFCVFEYAYCDAGNFKTHGRFLLTGATDGVEETLRACLEWGDQSSLSRFVFRRCVTSTGRPWAKALQI